MLNSTSTNSTGTGIINRVINALPFELHIPGYQFCGPGTRLSVRLARGDRGINPLDAACRTHDIAYSRSNDLTDRHTADRILGEKARERITARDSGLGERAAATAVWAAMKAKTKMGVGMRKRKSTSKRKKRRTLPIAKRGGLLPLLPMLGVLGSLIGGASGVARAVNASKEAKRRLEEMKRHNQALEGRGLYLSPYKRGTGAKSNKKRKGAKKKKLLVERDVRKITFTIIGCYDSRAIESIGASIARTLL